MNEFKYVVGQSVWTSAQMMRKIEDRRVNGGVNEYLFGGAVWVSEETLDFVQGRVLGAEGGKKQIVYVVHAYRWGDRECHSYSVGVYSKKHAALKAAQTERDYRGGKYECEVLEWALDSGTDGGHDARPKIVQALPLIRELQDANQDRENGGAGMNKIEGTVIAASRLESGEQATCGIVVWTTDRQKAEMERWESNGLVVVERKADHDAREAEVERLRDANLKRVAEGMSAWCSPPDEQATKGGEA